MSRTAVAHAEALVRAVASVPGAPRLRVWAKPGFGPWPPPPSEVRVYFPNGEFVSVDRGGRVDKVLRGKTTFLESTLFGLHLESGAIYGADAPKKDPQRYFNSPAEVRAYMQEIVAESRAFVRSHWRFIRPKELVHRALDASPTYNQPTRSTPSWLARRAGPPTRRPHPRISRARRSARR